MFTKVANLKKKIVLPDGSFKEYTEVFAKGEYPAGDFIGQRLTDVSSGTVYAWDGSAWQTQGGGGGVPEGCILEYTFDDQNFNDTSGNGNNGTQGGATFVEGIVGPYAATRSSGSTSSFPLDAITTLPLTFSMFLQFPAANSTLTYALYFTDNNLKFYAQVILRPADGLRVGGKFGAYPFTANEVFHLAFIIGENKTGAVYINGSLVADNVSFSYSQSQHYSFILGSNDAGEYWPGKLDQFRIFNRVLSAEEIQHLANERNW